MDVSVIIVNYNTKQITLDCINSIFEKTVDVDFEVILVDNNSTDGSREVFDSDSRIKYLYLNENLGFGKANNYGIERAVGEYVFCLNSDTILLNNAIFEFFKFAKDSGHLGCIGSMLLKKDKTENLSYGKFPDWKEHFKLRVLGPVYNIFGKEYFLDEFNYRLNKKASSFAVDFVIGADLFVKKESLEKYGAFDPEFFMYFEETELQNRLTKNGCGSMIITTPRIIHLDGGSYSSESSKLTIRQMQAMISEFLYFKKTASWVRYFLFRFAFILARLPYLFVLGKDERKRYWRVFLS
jgi:GT2 family glycosyltransferase